MGGGPPGMNVEGGCVSVDCGVGVRMVESKVLLEEGGDCVLRAVASAGRVVLQTVMLVATGSR